MDKNHLTQRVNIILTRCVINVKRFLSNIVLIAMQRLAGRHGAPDGAAASRTAAAASRNPAGALFRFV
jgi:hypothetical protein